MRQLAGTTVLLRLNLRRDRFTIPACAVAFALVVYLTAASMDSLYPALEDRRALAATVGENPGISAIRGAARGLDTIGGLVAFQIGTLAALFAGLMSLLLVNRHTRADEEEGRTELVLSAATGREAPLAAALGAVLVANVAVGAATAAALVAYGLPLGGSLVFGVWLGAVGMAFAAIAACAAQLTENARGVTGIALSALGIAYLLRATADAEVGAGALTWLSPLGWGQELRAFSDERLWPLAGFALLTAATIAVAYLLQSRRDFDQGYLPQRPGPPEAAPGLGTPRGLALRLQRGTLIGWTVGLVVLACVYGVFTGAVESFARDSEGIADYLAEAGGATLVDSWFASIAGILAVFVAGFAVQATLRARAEEAAGRAESLLATRMSRWRWAGSHLAVAILGSLALLLATGVASGLTAWANTGEISTLTRLTGATLAHAPAVWVVAALALFFFAVAPRASLLAWAAFAWITFVEVFGPMIDLPGRLADSTPFAPLPDLPAASVEIVPLVALTALAALLTAVGLAVLERRDLDLS